MTGGGVQTPGFMGHGKHFISSKKFMKAEGGIERIVWLPKELKEQMRDKLNAAAKELYDVDNFDDMIADALAGKIDLIITKSVSRFARNTVDSLTTIRLLKEHGVEVGSALPMQQLGRACGIAVPASAVAIVAQ